ncbi:MAG: hypothetical protein KIT43_08095 [Bauldia sp.]|nr:hypothetical protein [Bauldia sp.]
MKRYLIADFIEAWRAEGHSVVHVAGTADLPDADIAILHVDLSVVPRRYADAVARYPLVLNGRIADIRKRRVSQALAPRGYGGPVMVKTDRNYGGRPEIARLSPWRAKVARAAMRVAGRRLVEGEYPVFPTRAAVPFRLRWHPGLVIECFLPEREGEAVFVRQAMFLGDRDVSWRLRGDGPVVRSDGSRGNEEVPTPAAVRDFRRSVGLDYGKIDYLEVQGEAVVIDVAKTVGGSGSAPETVKRLAGGLSDLWLKRAARSRS